MRDDGRRAAAACPVLRRGAPRLRQHNTAVVTRRRQHLALWRPGQARVVCDSRSAATHCHARAVVDALSPSRLSLSEHDNEALAVAPTAAADDAVAAVAGVTAAVVVDMAVVVVVAVALAGQADVAAAVRHCALALPPPQTHRPSLMRHARDVRMSVAHRSSHAVAAAVAVAAVTDAT